MPPKVDLNKCEGIGACAEACPVDVIDIEEDEKGNLKSVIARPDDCVECGNCVDACPTGGHNPGLKSLSTECRHVRSTGYTSAGNIRQPPEDG
ncbi:MAG: ferredoxin family protein, partial [Methanosarcinaceae archaeon]|nr:ferredoxin family protein [Methanosarcinaceae archaeon]